MIAHLHLSKSGSFTGEWEGISVDQEELTKTNPKPTKETLNQYKALSFHLIAATAGARFIRFKYNQKKPGKLKENQLANKELWENQSETKLDFNRTDPVHTARPSTSLKIGIPSAISHDTIQITAHMPAHAARAVNDRVCIEFVPRKMRT
jgi:hypothetical protein